MRTNEEMIGRTRGGWPTVLRVLRVIAVAAPLSALGAVAVTSHAIAVAGPAALLVLGMAIATLATESRVAPARIRR
jgi:hypothetical protein